jgi:asparagine N-glycosylation enzyme membrane subunit Stt3
MTIVDFLTELIPTIKIAVLGVFAWIVSGIESFAFLLQSISRMQDIELISSYLGLIIKAITLISVIAVAITNIYRMMNHKNNTDPESLSGGDNEDGSSGVEPPEKD